MTRRRLSAAVAVSLLGALALLAYLFWAYLLGAALMWALWRITRHRLGWRPRPRRGRTVLELAAAGAAGWWAARKAEDVLAHAVRSGAEIQVVVGRPDARRQMGQAVIEGRARHGR